MKITKAKLKHIIKEELTLIADVNDKRDYIEAEYEKFAERGRSLNSEDTLLVFASLMRNLTGLNANDHFEELAALYKEYIAPAQEVFDTRKAEVAEDLAALEASVRTAKPYMGSKEISSRKELEREISNHRMLTAILNKL